MLDGPAAHSAEPWWRRHRSLVVVGSYALSSYCVVVFNKLLFEWFPMVRPAFLLALHSLLLVAVFLLLEALSILPAVRMSLAMRTRALPVSIWCALNSIFGLAATEGLSLSSFTAMRRLTILLTLGSQWLILNLKPSNAATSGVLLMVTGALVVTVTEAGTNEAGYVAVLLNNVLTTGSRILIRQLHDDPALIGINSASLLFESAVVSGICATVWLAMSGGVTPVLVAMSSPWLPILLLASSAAAIASMFSNVLTVNIKSPLTAAVVGSAKNILTTYTGMAFSHASVLANIGHHISIAGAVVYAFSELGP